MCKFIVIVQCLNQRPRKFTLSHCSSNNLTSNLTQYFTNRSMKFFHTLYIHSIHRAIFHSKIDHIDLYKNELFHSQFHTVNQECFIRRSMKWIISHTLNSFYSFIELLKLEAHRSKIKVIHRTIRPYPNNFYQCT